MRRGAALILALVPALAGAQTGPELSEIRAGLVALHAELRALEAHLSPADGTPAPLAGATALERMAAIERELQRLTARSEEMDFHIRRIVEDGSAQVAALERRLCALEPNCDPAQLGETPMLGGGAPVPVRPLAPATPSGPQFAVDERAAFDRARALYDAGDDLSAIEGFAAHVATWPGGPLAIEAELLRGRALERSGDVANAARAYLAAFSADKEGPLAAEALTALGQAMARLGQSTEACVTLAEVGTRFPESAAAIVASAARAQLPCP